MAKDIIKRGERSVSIIKKDEKTTVTLPLNSTRKRERSTITPIEPSPKKRPKPKP